MHTRIRRTLIALAGAALLTTTTPADASVSVSEALVTITPSTATITVNGHGFGHGHGMSQYGAKGAALNGQSAAQILAFYYPGTALTPLSASIKVLITADTDNNTTVYPERGLRVRDLGNGRTYKLHKKSARMWRLASKHGHTKVFYKTRHWHLYKTGHRRSLAGDGEFRSAAGGVTLKLPTGPRKYRGSLRFTNSDTVNVLNLEKYLRGVVAAEMPSSWPAAALQAQAVAARTYAARERADHLDRYYQICDTTACQVYGGVKSETPATDAAAAATAGQVLSYGGQFAFAQFSSSNGGLLSAGSEPYLVAKADPWDTAAVDPYFNWTPPSTATSYSVAALRTAYGTGDLTGVQITEREDAAAADKGRVVTVVLHGSTGDKALTGAQVRSLLGLRSTYFSITP